MFLKLPIIVGGQYAACGGTFWASVAYPKPTTWRVSLMVYLYLFGLAGGFVVLLSALVLLAFGF
jgi:hypothetical protein